VVARYVIVLRPKLGESRPVTVRLRQALKLLLRVCRLRRAAIEPEHHPNEKEQPPPDKECGCSRKHGEQYDTGN